jgi:hypothetical protein
MLAVQNLVVFMVVLGSSMYAAWVLIPSVWRRAIAARLLRLLTFPSPAWLRTALQQAAAAGSGCDCSGCDKAVGAKPVVRTVPTEAPVQVIRFHPPRKA